MRSPYYYTGYCRPGNLLRTSHSSSESTMHNRDGNNPFLLPLR
ncbi:hypothetical protein HMPREF9141_0921 [Prevotella multiformis DSM 16608]|uniref:Uncharacterized protein n=1 Tax=Prevotella multiformis DSM 16608 TaxID=888743 RepID=F0F5Q5_9BACT|nr:hypothetical protein HMPREF9141_0921 [Prevotella multiformis DSM 16608]